MLGEPPSFIFGVPQCRESLAPSPQNLGGTIRKQEENWLHLIW